MKNCPICGTANDDGAGSCVYCGSELPQTAPVQENKKKKRSSRGKRAAASASGQGRVCPMCGAVNGPADSYCSACFAELGSGSIENGMAGDVPSYCPCCGAENPAGTEYCLSCSSRIPTAPEKTKGSGKKSNLGVFAWIGAGVAAVVAVVVAVSLMLGGISNPAKKAVDSMADSVADQTHKMANLGTFADNFAALNESGKFAVILDAELPGEEMVGTVYYDRQKKLMSGSLELDSESMSLQSGLDFSLSNKEIMFRPQDSQEIFGCTMRGLANTVVVRLLNQNKMLNKMGVSMDQDLLENLFKKIDAPEESAKQIRTAWKKLAKSLEVDEAAERDGYRVFAVSIDEDSIDEFLDSVLGEGEFRKNLANFLTGVGPDIHLYIDADGNLAKADMFIGGEKCYLEFADSTDPLADCTLTSENGNIWGNMVSSSAGMKVSFFCAVGKSYLSMELTYDDATGEFLLSADFGNGYNLQVKGRLISRNGQAIVELEGYIPSMGDLKVRIGLDRLAVQPEQLSRNGKYLDILDFDNINRLMEAFNIKS